MTTNQRRLLTIAAIAVAAYCAADYPLGVHSPFDAFSGAAGTESKARTDTYSGCKDGTGVTLYTIKGGHHMWPGTRLSCNDVPATDTMWSFFAAHPKP